MTDLKPGDRVVLTNRKTGQTLPEVTVELTHPGRVWVLFDGTVRASHVWFSFSEWSFEKVTPKLPTEPGVYQDKDGEFWRLTSGGWDYLGDLISPHEIPVKRFAPFTRLVPEVQDAG